MLTASYKRKRRKFLFGFVPSFLILSTIFGLLIWCTAPSNETWRQIIICSLIFTMGTNFLGTGLNDPDATEAQKAENEVSKNTFYGIFLGNMVATTIGIVTLAVLHRF